MRLRRSRYRYVSRYKPSIRSNRSCKSSSDSDLQGSDQRLEVPCDRSTTPFSCGLRGLFQWTATPSPISHNERSVGKSPHAPQGTPLSTRMTSGRPHRAKAARSCSRTALGETFDQVPWGENLGVEHRAAAFIDHPEPAHLPTRF